jgi:hypothetical protein
MSVPATVSSSGHVPSLPTEAGSTAPSPCTTDVSPRSSAPPRQWRPPASWMSGVTRSFRAWSTRTRFSDPSYTHKEDIESGTRAVAAGGVTTVFDMPNGDPPTNTAARLRAHLQNAARKTMARRSWGSPG